MPRTRSTVRSLSLGVALAAIVGTAPTAIAQQSARQQQLDVIVVDRNQNPVTDLAPTDFVVREDGIAREVISVTAGAPPSPIMLLIDNSQAAEPALLDIRRGLATFVDLFGATDVQIGLKTFGERPTTVAAPTSAAMVRVGVDRIFHRTGAGAYLLEAIVETCQELRKAEVSGAAIVAFVVEAGPEFSTHDRKRVQEALGTAGASLWTVVLQSRGGGVPTTPEARERAAVIGDVTVESGGMNLPILTAQAIGTTFGRLRNLFVARQRITYGRPDTLIPPERLEVASRRDGLRVLAPRRAAGR